MAQVVSFKNLPMKNMVAGVATGSITDGATDWMEANLLRLSPGAALTETVPDGSDCYLFIVRGAATISSGDASQAMTVQTSAVIQQQSTYSLLNSFDGETEILTVLAPPKGATTDLSGFGGGLSISARKDIPVVDIPDQKKRRLYIVGGGAAASERGHAMIVMYEQETFTALHHHPNAESMFVLLDGNISFTIDGKEVNVGPGEATVFKAGDIHGLRCSEGVTEASFLEFHIPGAFSTVKD